MPQLPIENTLQSYYQTFDRRHDKYCKELLDSLPSVRGAAQSNKARFLPLRLTYSRLVLAALLLVAIGLFLSLGGSPTQPVYGMEHLAARLLTIRSLHLKGWMYQTITSGDGEESVQKFPTELYAKRPNCTGYRTYGFSSPGGGKPSVVRSGFVANNGEQMIVVSHNDQKATLANVADDVFRNEMLVESFIQSSLANKFLQGPPEYYRKVRSEKVQGVLCDVYEYDPQEYVLAGRHRVWLNPLTGIPMKSESSNVDESGNEKLFRSEIIRVDVEPPIPLFSFQAPEGYEATSHEATSKQVANFNPSSNKLSPYGEGGSDTTWLGTWHCFNINDRAVLACWFQYDTNDKKEKEYFARQPKIVLYQGNTSRTCREHTLSTNSVDKSQWRWSLILPEDGKPIGEYMLRLKVADKRTNTTQELKPLRLSRERLQEILLEAQRRTLPNESQQKLFTLEDLEAIE